MKREILHYECRPRPRGVRLNDDPFVVAERSLEKTRVVVGQLRVHCHCDACNGPMEPGRRVAAVSYAGPGQHLYDWEYDFIEETR